MQNLLVQEVSQISRMGTMVAGIIVIVSIVAAVKVLTLVPGGVVV